MVDFCEGGDNEFDITTSLAELKTRDFYCLGTVSISSKKVIRELTL